MLARRTGGIAFVAALILFGSIGQGEDPAPKAEGKFRVWKDASGQFEIRHELLQVDGDIAQLRKPDGIVLQISVARLSPADREFLKVPANPNPFAAGPQQQAAERASRSIVIVTYERNGVKESVPGFVARSDDERSYVVVQPFGPRQSSSRRARPEKDYKFTVSWGIEAPLRETPVELVGVFSTEDYYLLAAPRKDLPPPLEMDIKARAAASAAVQVVGFESSEGKRAGEFRRVTTAGKVKGPNSGNASGIPGFQVDITDSQPPKFAIVLNDAGKGIGVYYQRPHGSILFRPGSSAIWPLNLSSMDDLAEVHVENLTLMPIHDESLTRDYEFVAVISDPLGIVKSTQALVKRRKSKAERSPSPVPAGLPGPRLIGAEEITLERREPAKAYERTVKAMEEQYLGKAWLGKVTTKDEAAPPRHDFDVQIVVTLRDGKVLDLPLQSMGYQWERPKPSNYPEIRRHPQGGYQLTSDKTKQLPLPPPERTTPLPTPNKSNRVIHGESPRAGEWEMVTLELGRLKTAANTTIRTPAAFSAGGDWLYVVDSNNVLRQINTQTLREERVLDIGLDCTHLSISREGLIVALSKADVVWVVDPDSLQVKREFSLDGVEVAAASPASHLGLAFGMKRNGPSLVKMWVVDYARGQALHELKGHYSDGRVSASLEVEHRQLFLTPPRTAQFTADGKKVFVAGVDMVRFRLEGEDLIFEQRGGIHDRNGETQLAISGDGRLAALPETMDRRPGPDGPAVQGNRGKPGVSLRDGQNLDKEIAFLDTQDYCWGLAVEPKKGNLIAATPRKILFFSPAGKLLTEIPAPSPDPLRIFVHPKDEQFFVWGNTELIYFRKPAAK